MLFVGGIFCLHQKLLIVSNKVNLIIRIEAVREREPVPMSNLRNAFNLRSSSLHIFTHHAGYDSGPTYRNTNPTVR